MPYTLNDCLSWDGSSAKITSLDDYLADYNPRMKSVMAFDNLEMNEKSGENLEFGDETHQYLHFDSYMPDVLEKLKTDYPEEYSKYAEATMPLLVISTGRAQEASESVKLYWFGFCGHSRTHPHPRRHTGRRYRSFRLGSSGSESGKQDRCRCGLRSGVESGAWEC